MPPGELLGTRFSLATPTSARRALGTPRLPAAERQACTVQDGSVASRRVVHAALIVLTAGLVALWVGGSLMLWLTGGLMSVDEEWQGWGDILLNPFVVGPWLAVTGACAASGLALTRHEKANRISRDGG